MHHRFLILAAAAAAAAWGPMPVQQEARRAAGMILDAAGNGTIERGGERIALALGELLYSGDRLVTGAGPATLLFCPTSERITLQPNTRAELTRDGVAVRRGASPATMKVQQCALPRVALGRESLERIGGLRARGYPPIPLYLGGLVGASRPSFEWAALPGADAYRLSLRTAAGAELWESENRAPRADYPAGRPELPAGAYEWELLALAAGKTIARQAATFEVRPGAAVPEAVDPLAAAAALENAGYYAEAASHYRALREKNPGDPRLTRRLAWLYWNAGLIAAADEEVKKVRK